MVSKFKKFLSQNRRTVPLTLIALGLMVLTFTAYGKHSTAVADSCDKVNIVYCGLDGSSNSGYINSFEKFYESNKSGHDASPTVKKNYTDLKTVFNHFGASANIVNKMNTSNTKVGYVYRDGRVVVDGKTVGTGAQVAARFSVPGAYNIDGTNVYVRKTTSSFAQDKAKVIVYFNGDDEMVFGVMVTCGNPIKAKPVVPEKPKPAPKPQALNCVSLAATPTSVKNQYAFQASASTSNGATISSYTFNYGNGKSDTIPTNAATGSVTHTYETPGNFTATVTVNGTVDGNPTPATSGACQTPISIAAPAAQALACVSLAATATSVKDQYTFTATASPTNGATISSYTFNYGNGKSDTIASTTTTANATHTYAAPGAYTAIVTVNGTADGQAVSVTGPGCQTPITIVAPQQGLACVTLKSTPSATVKNQYTFDATAAVSNGAVISNYVFTFGDGKSTTVTTNAITAQTVYTYAGPGIFPATVTVNGTANGQPVSATNVNCGTKITINQPECKPGIPEGDVRCKDVCPYNPALPVDSPDCKKPELPHTGPAGMVTLFGATSAFGAVGHRLYLKRRLR